MSTDEIMALADLYYHNPYRDGSHTHLVYADQKRVALLKAVEALVADAARYRWLRDNREQTFTDCIFDDAVIDAARKEAP